MLDIFSLCLDLCRSQQLTSLNMVFLMSYCFTILQCIGSNGVSTQSFMSNWWEPLCASLCSSRKISLLTHVVRICSAKKQLVQRLSCVWFSFFWALCSSFFPLKFSLSVLCRFRATKTRLCHIGHPDLEVSSDFSFWRTLSFPLNKQVVCLHSVLFSKMQTCIFEVWLYETLFQRCIWII